MSTDTALAADLSPSYVAVLEHVVKLPDDARQAALWILEQMTESFLLLAFAQNADACDEARKPHPYAPRNYGRSYDAALAACQRDGKVPEGLDAECRDLAARLYLGILRAPGGYDPAPAVLRWDGVHENTVSHHWRSQAPTDAEAAARCWGHYAVMAATGQGVSWEDDNAPLTAARVSGDGDGRVCYELPAVGDLGFHMEAPIWIDEHTPVDPA